MEVELYKVDREKEKQVMKELEELEKSDEKKKEDNSLVKSLDKYSLN